MFGKKPVHDPRVLCAGEAIVVPSVPELDPPPASMERDYPNSTFIYTGPLFLKKVFDSIPPDLEQWCADQRSKGRSIVAVTTGTDWGREFCVRLVQSMECAKFSCVLIIPRLRPGDADRYSHPHLRILQGCRLDEAVALCDVVVHHCGQKTYQAVVLAGKPSITIPSYSYDRQDNAIRLEELGCGIHLHDGLYRNGLDIEMLNDAVERVICDNAMAQATARMAARLASFMAERGPSYVLNVLEKRDLVRPRPNRLIRRKPRPQYLLPRFPWLRIWLHSSRERLRNFVMRSLRAVWPAC